MIGWLLYQLSSVNGGNPLAHKLPLNQIVQGNCVQILEKEIDDETINLVFADPPYNLSGKMENR